MTAKIIGINKTSSKHGGPLIWMFFKTKGAKSYKTYLVPTHKNYKRWAPIIARWENRADDIWLEGLIVKNEDKQLVDADSLFYVVRRKTIRKAEQV